MDKNTVYKVQKYLKDNGIADINDGNSKVQLRANGKSFTLEEHVEGMILSLISPETVWNDVEKNLGNIRKIFFGYSPEKIMTKCPGRLSAESAEKSSRERYTQRQGWLCLHARCICVIRSDAR